MSSTKIHKKIENFDKKTDNYLNQYLKNNKVIEQLLDKAEKSEGEDKQKLIKQIERAMEFNKSYKSAAERNLKQLTLHKSSLKNNPEIHRLPSVPSYLPTRKKGGKKYRKQKYTKKDKITQKKTKLHKKRQNKNISSIILA